MAGLDEMKVRIGVDLSTLTKGAADAARIISGIGVAASSISPVFAKTASAADNLQVSLGKIKNVDLSGLTPFVSSAAKVLGDTANAANLTIEPLNKSAKASADLDAALAKMASDGTARINQLATEALGLNDAFKGVASPNLPPIRVGAIPPLVVPTGPAIKSIQELENEITELQTRLKNSVNPAEFKALDAEITKLASHINNIKVVGLETTLAKLGNSTGGVAGKLNSLKPSSDRAGASLIDFGRIAQDAAFGPIAISNNISPLFESFGRLTKETGSVKGAISALGGALLGGGGLGVGVSILTGLIGFASVGLSNWTRGFGKNAEATGTAKKNIDEYNSSLKSISDNLSKEATQISTLVAALQSDTVARQQKVTALKELQSIAPDYFGSLKMEHGLVTGLTAAYGAYLNALKERFKTKAIDNDLEKLFNKKLNLEIQLDGDAKTFLSKETTDRITRLQGQIEDLGGVQILKGADFTKYTEAQKKVESLLNAITLLQGKNKLERIGDVKISNDLNTVNKEIDGLLAKRGQLSNFDLKFTPDPKKSATEIKDVNDVLAELNKELELNRKYASIGFISSEEEDVNKINKVKAAIQEMIALPKGKAIQTNSPIITQLLGDIKPEEVRKQLGERSAEIVKTLKTAGTGLKELPEIKIPIELKPSVNTDRAIAEIDKKLLEDFNKLAGDIQKSVLNSGLSSIGETIGAAIGGGDVAGAFRGLLSVVINGMKQLGEAMIGLGTAKTVLEKFNIAPGIGTIAAGIGIIALSSLIQSALPKFADGTQGFRGGMAVVGERGPEIVQLPAGANVIPNHRLDTITGNTQQVFIPSISLRGSDLLVAFNRAQAQQTRRG